MGRPLVLRDHRYHRHQQRQSSSSSSPSFVVISAMGLTGLLLIVSCYSLEVESFLPSSSSIGMMRRSNVGGGRHQKQQLPPHSSSSSLLTLKGGADPPNSNNSNKVNYFDYDNSNNKDDSTTKELYQTSASPDNQVGDSGGSGNLEEGVVSAAASAPAGILGGHPPGWFRTKFPNLPYHRFPDYLTYARCVAIPLLCIMFYKPNQHIGCGIIFALASLTDWLDGFLARRWNVSTAFGAFLDPVADKLMVSTALILLSGRHGAIVAIPTCIILARELAVSALREWMATRGQRDTVQVGMQGKVKTALTMVALTLMLLVPEIVGKSWLGNLFLPSLIALYGCTVITVTSGAVYFRAAAPYLLEK